MIQVSIPQNYNLVEIKRMVDRATISVTHLQNIDKEIPNNYKEYPALEKLYFALTNILAPRSPVHALLNTTNELIQGNTVEISSDFAARAEGAVLKLLDVLAHSSPEKLDLSEHIYDQIVKFTRNLAKDMHGLEQPFEDLARESSTK